jgi:hypothetical protein
MTMFVDQTLPEDPESVQEILPEDLDKISGAMRNHYIGNLIIVASTSNPNDG